MSLGQRTNDEDRYPSSDDDVESLLTSSDDQEERDVKDRGCPSERCALVTKLQQGNQKSTVYALAKAHLDLDLMNSGLASPSMWANIARLLKIRYSGKAALGSKQLSEKSMVRLSARLDAFFTGCDTKDFFSTLRAEEKTSFNACLQSWRKVFRGCQVDYTGKLRCWLSTSLEVSRISGKAYPTLTVCCAQLDLPDTCPLDGIDLDELGQWSELIICSDTPWKFRHALKVLLPHFRPRVCIEARQHDSRRYCAPLEAVLPPLLYTTDADLRRIRRGSSSKSMLDSSKVYWLISDNRDLVQQNEPVHVSLMAMCVWTLKRTGQKLDEHAHLSYLSRHAYRCASCDRIVLPPASIQGLIGMEGVERAAKRAGFIFPSLGVAALMHAVQSNSHWLPPFREPILELHEIGTRDPFRRYNPQILDTARSTASPELFYYIGGCEADDKDKDEDSVMVGVHDSWRFCLPCACDHLGVQGLFEAVSCRCRVCRFERTCDPLLRPDDTAKIRFNSIWSRDGRRAAASGDGNVQYDNTT